MINLLFEQKKIYIYIYIYIYTKRFYAISKLAIFKYSIIFQTVMYQKIKLYTRLDKMPIVNRRSVRTRKRSI